MPGLVVTGTSTCRQFTSGYKFTLTRHFNADGPYVLTAVEHAIDIEQQASGTALGADFGIKDMNLAETQVERLAPVRMLMQQVAEVRCRLVRCCDC